MRIDREFEEPTLVTGDGKIERVPPQFKLPFHDQRNVWVG